MTSLREAAGYGQWLAGLPNPGAAYSRETIDAASCGAGIGFWVCDLPSETLSWTDGTYDLFGVPRGKKITREQALEAYSEQSCAALGRLRQQAISTRSSFVMDAEICTPAGQLRWIRINAKVECERGRPRRLLGMKQDITEWHLAIEQLRRKADFDALTGLASRSHFDARLEQVCAGTGQAALLLVDLDGFKAVNDSIGHAAGDECLRQIARRLSTVCRRADLVARLGGDEFGIVLASPVLAPEALAEQIVRAVSQPVLCPPETFRLGASVGIARIAGGTEPKLAFELADKALYRAKFSGGARYKFAC